MIEPPLRGVSCPGKKKVFPLGFPQVSLHPLPGYPAFLPARKVSRWRDGLSYKRTDGQWVLSISSIIYRWGYPLFPKACVPEIKNPYLLFLM
jgi:hypothetical protein